MEASRGAGAGQWPEDRGGDQGAGDGRAGWRGTCRTGGLRGARGPAGLRRDCWKRGRAKGFGGKKKVFFLLLIGIVMVLDYFTGGVNIACYPVNLLKISV